MCGIVGYLGQQQAETILLEGLSKLEYRGYDSAGICIQKNGELSMSKAKGRLKNLAQELEHHHLEGHAGIGHTRWATHGAPSDINSHPHASMSGNIAVVHNGIIENHNELRSKLQAEGIEFRSATDTEVIPNLIESYLSKEGSLLKAVARTVKELKGSYALGILSKGEPGQLIAVRKDSPLIVGVGDKERFIASDVPAILKYTKQVVYLDNQEIAVLNADAMNFYDYDLNPLAKDIHEITWTAELAEKGGYDHFTLKEIHEQPKALRDTMTGRIQPGNPIRLDELELTEEQLKAYRRIYIVACGTAYHAGLAGKKAIENLARIPVEVDVASEFRYRNPIVDQATLVIVISQSGETADTLAVLRDAKAKGARVIAVTNVVGSSIARDADDVIYTWAGPEIGVASTKAYLTQLVAMYTLAMKFAEILNISQGSDLDELKSALLNLPEKVEEALAMNEKVRAYAETMFRVHDVYFLGRGLDNVTATEGSLKLKELTYIHSESYPGGELKHGPIALIEDGTVVISPVTQSDLVEKMVSNLHEVKTRGSRNLILTMEKHLDIVRDAADEVFILPDTHDLITPVLAIIPLQLLAYHVSLLKGFDVDKPRNLAKSVTVE